MSSITMGIDEILKYLPHRYPFLLLDKVIELQLEKSIVAVKNVSMNEAHFAGHFPQTPVMPGVLMIEALAQAGAVLAYRSTNSTPTDGILYYLAGIKNARFKRIVKPGDQLQLHVAMEKARGGLWILQSKAIVDDQVACTAELMCFRDEKGVKS